MNDFVAVRKGVLDPVFENSVDDAGKLTNEVRDY